MPMEAHSSRYAFVFLDSLTAKFWRNADATNPRFVMQLGPTTEAQAQMFTLNETTGAVEDTAELGAYSVPTVANSEDSYANIFNDAV